MKILFRIILVLSITIGVNSISIAQPPPPAGHGATGNAPPGGGAPVGEGLFLLIGLAGLYAGKKVYALRNTLKVE